MQTKNKTLINHNERYSAPQIEVVELAVECGFSMSSLDQFDSNDADPIDKLDKWSGWED